MEADAALCVCVRETVRLRCETQAGRSWRGLAAAVETWMEASELWAKQSYLLFQRYI